MKHINKILVASELNKESYEALVYGITLGLIYDAEVSCIHVVKPSPIDIIKETLQIGSAKYGDALKNATEESQELLSHIIDVIGRELGVGEVDVNLKIVTGNLSRSIMNHADEIDADLVIIGTESGTRFSRTAHTNLALNMIKLEKANVLLIPSGFQLEQIEQYGSFINFEEDEVDFVYKLINHAKVTENPVKLLHVMQHGENVDKVNENRRFFELLLSKEIKDQKISIEVVQGPLPDVVNNLKKKFNIDLMVMRAYHRHWDMYSSTSSFADKVISNIKCPLMIWKTTRKDKRSLLNQRLQETVIS